VKIGNLIDHLQVTGGFWKEQRRRRLECFVRHSEKLKKELEQMELEDTDQSEQADEDDEEFIDFM
jgi:hypothetical protein